VAMVLKLVGDGRVKILYFHYTTGCQADRWRPRTQVGGNSLDSIMASAREAIPSLSREGRFSR